MYHGSISPVCWVNREMFSLTIDYGYYYLSVLGKNLLVEQAQNIKAFQFLSVTSQPPNKPTLIAIHTR
jgi:hypothetical protein